MDSKGQTLGERLAALEERVAADLEARLELKQDIAELKAKQGETTKELHTLLRKIERWEGKFGGILFVVGCLWAFVVGIPKVVLTWWNGG